MIEVRNNQFKGGRYLFPLSVLKCQKISSVPDRKIMPRGSCEVEVVSK